MLSPQLFQVIPDNLYHYGSIGMVVNRKRVFQHALTNCFGREIGKIKKPLSNE
jgi:hypothetical protein